MLEAQQTDQLRPCSRESDRVALITNYFIVAGVFRHWGPKRPQYPAVRDFECARDGSAAHATTMHEEDQFALEGLGHGAGQFV